MITKYAAKWLYSSGLKIARDDVVVELAQKNIRLWQFLSISSHPRRRRL